MPIQPPASSLSGGCGQINPLASTAAGTSTMSHPPLRTAVRTLGIAEVLDSLNSAYQRRMLDRFARPPEWRSDTCPKRTRESSKLTRLSETYPSA